MDTDIDDLLRGVDGSKPPWNGPFTAQLVDESDEDGLVVIKDVDGRAVMWMSRRTWDATQRRKDAMEYYTAKCNNPECMRTYNYVGYKTAMYKTEEQLAKMKRDRTVCRYCGKESLQTGLDHDSPDAKALDAALADVVKRVL